MSQIMANSKDGQGHKDKYLHTSRKVLSQEMLMWNIKVITQLLARSKNWKNGPNSNVKVIG